MADTMKCLFLNIISSQILFSILFFCNYVSQYSLLILPYKRVLDQLKHAEMAFPAGSTWINDTSCSVRKCLLWYMWNINTLHYILMVSV